MAVENAAATHARKESPSDFLITDFVNCLGTDVIWSVLINCQVSQINTCALRVFQRWSVGSSYPDPYLLCVLDRVGHPCLVLL